MNTPPIPGNAEDTGGYLSKYEQTPQKTYATVMDQVMDGTRFVMVPYVFSIFILSFKRSMGGIHEVRTGQYPIGKLFLAALVTVLFGFWGIPFGIIWSIAACYHLFRGGREVTYDILDHAVGHEEAKRILKIARKPKPPLSIWLVRAIAIAPLVLVGLVILSGR